MTTTLPAGQLELDLRPRVAVPSPRAPHAWELAHSYASNVMHAAGAIDRNGRRPRYTMTLAQAVEVLEAKGTAPELVAAYRRNQADLAACSSSATVIIPCGAEKLDRPARAEDLYVGAMFRHALRAAKATGARVLILSAKYGLVTLDAVLEPYDVKAGDPGTVDRDTLRAQAAELGLAPVGNVRALLPQAYLDLLRDAGVYALDLYLGCAGIGHQRGVCSRLAGA